MIRQLLCWSYLGGVVAWTNPSTAADTVEFHVCRRPPNVPSGWARWSYTGSNTVPSFETSDKRVFDSKTVGMAVFVYDPWAPQSSMRVLPMPHNRLPCPPPPGPRPPDPTPPAQVALVPKTPPTPKTAPTPPTPKSEAKTAPKAAPKTGGSSGDAKPKEDKPGSGIKKLPPGTILPIDKNPSKQAMSDLPPSTEVLGPAPSPLPDSTAILPKSDEVGAGIRSLNQGERNALEDRDPTRGGGPGKAGHAPVTGFDRIAYELAFAAAMVNGQFNEDLYKPGSSAHGIVGGRNPDGPDSAVIQAAVSFTQIASGAVVTQAAKFAQRLKKAFVVQEKIVLNGVDDVTAETAEALARQYGVDIAEALMKNGTIGPYSVMKKFTDKLGGSYQAHHIFEAAKIKRFMKGADPDKFPAVILTKDAHKKITAELAAKASRMTDLKKTWKVYEEVYVDHPDWLDAIRQYFE